MIHETYDTDNLFCVECGTRNEFLVDKKCAKCYAFNTAKADYCRYCGEKL
jgi:ribosomal protein L40E